MTVAATTDPIGTDISTYGGLSFAPKSGVRVVVEAIFRRLTTDRGGLFYALDYGTDLRELLLGRISQALLYKWKGAIEQECMRDDRVSTADAQLTFDFSTERLVVEIQIEIATGEQAGFSISLASSPDAAAAGAFDAALDMPLG